MTADEWWMMLCDAFGGRLIVVLNIKCSIMELKVASFERDCSGGG